MSGGEGNDLYVVVGRTRDGQLHRLAHDGRSGVCLFAAGVVSLKRNPVFGGERGTIPCESRRPANYAANESSEP